MLTAYIDESFESPDGYAVMAGFVGRKESWRSFAERWRVGLGAKPALHMKSLRNWTGDRHIELLKTLGAIPHQCGLNPVFAAIRLADYKDKVVDYGGPIENGYFVTLAGVVCTILSKIPTDERVQIVFEQQNEYAPAREKALEVISKLPNFYHRKRSRLAKWESSPKSLLLEPSDYFAYALMQNLRDISSRRTQLCYPILSQGRKRWGGMMGKPDVRKILRMKRTRPM